MPETPPLEALEQIAQINADVRTKMNRHAWERA
jgi:hypothetical protein